MGLFDSYGFGDTEQGGLIDRLMAQLGVQGGYQPSQGFAPNPMDANAQMQPQAQPIPVGDYQMPRMGTADQFTPQMNANAQMQPQQAPTQPGVAGQQPAFLQQPQSGPLATSFQSWANTPVGNPMAALANGISRSLSE